jgi:hypothetical protein
MPQANVTTIDVAPVESLRQRLAELGIAESSGKWVCPSCYPTGLPIYEPPDPRFKQKSADYHLAVTESPDGHAVVACAKGCTVDTILGILGLTADDLKPTALLPDNTRATAVYSYTALHGRLLYQHLVNGEIQAWRHRHNGAWSIGTGIGKRHPTVLWRFGEVMRAVRGGRQLWLADSESDVLALNKQLAKNDLPAYATCAPGGHAGFEHNMGADLIGAYEVVVVGNPAQRWYARQVVRAVMDAGIPYRFEEPRAATLADHFAQGYSVGGLMSVN